MTKIYFLYYENVLHIIQLKDSYYLVNIIRKKKNTSCRHCLLKTCYLVYYY